jgi:predicted  nucleic acid-binding Zn-ribbon protein
MSKNDLGKVSAAAALEDVSRKVADKVAPKLERLRAASGNAREVREDVADLNETVEELAEEVAQVKHAVKAARKRRAGADGAGEE